MEFVTIEWYAEAFLEPQNWRYAMIYAAVGFLVVFVFQAIALYTIASRNGLKHKWMAFVPFLSTYYIGVCSQKNKALWFDSKIIGIIAASVEFVLCAGWVMHYVGHHFAEPYMEWVDILDIQSYLSYFSYFGDVGEIDLPQVLRVDWSRIPYELYWAGFCCETLQEILFFVNYAYSFIMVMLLVAFFQTYMPSRYVLFTILSVIFPIKGIFFFIMRKNRGKSYNEYVMREQERRYRMYRQFYTQNNPYNQPNYGERPYEGNDPPRSDVKNDDPFEEFGHPDDDPFSN